MILTIVCITIPVIAAVIATGISLNYTLKLYQEDLDA